MFNLFMPERREKLLVVTVSCPKCPRSFRTLAWIAEAHAPRCPHCDAVMEMTLDKTLKPKHILPFE